MVTRTGKRKFVGHFGPAQFMKELALAELKRAAQEVLEMYPLTKVYRYEVEFEGEEYRSARKKDYAFKFDTGNPELPKDDPEMIVYWFSSFNDTMLRLIKDGGADEVDVLALAKGRESADDMTSAALVEFIRGLDRGQQWEIIRELIRSINPTDHEMMVLEDDDY